METTKTSSADIAKRFFAALDYLINNKTIRGYQTFTARNGITRTNLNIILRNPESLALKPVYLSWLAEQYGISARWLLTGAGEMLEKDELERVENLEKRYKTVAQIKLLAAQL